MLNTPAIPQCQITLSCGSLIFTGHTLRRKRKRAGVEYLQIIIICLCYILPIFHGNFNIIAIPNRLFGHFVSEVILRNFAHIMIFC